MALSVKLEAFEGPLDLLLHLIDKNKVDIYDIPIVEITEQYLDYIKQMEVEDMNVMSEFLVMAATLLDIKCRMLLPKEVNEEGEEEDPRAELVQKLLEHKMYKYMSLELRDRQVDAERFYYRAKDLPKEVADYRPPLDYEELIGELYVLLSDNDWYILRQFKGKNNAQLYSYLSRCATNHFMSTKKREGKNLFVYPDDDKNIIKELNDMSCEEEYDTTTVMIAYEKLDPRDRDVLQQLVVEGKSSMEAAEKLWPYVNSDKDWRDLPAKRVQNTIAMIKHRAIIRLATEISRISY